VKVRGALGPSELDQEFRGFRIAALDRDRFIDGSDHGEELAADLPGIVSAAPRIGNSAPGNAAQKSLTKARLIGSSVREKRLRGKRIEARNLPLLAS
jgi:hypothetical protein